MVPSTARPVEVVEYDGTWPAKADEVIGQLRRALGLRALRVEHVGSTSVPGLPAKPIIDIDLTVADPASEHAWLPLLEARGFVLTVRELWWHEHRLVKGDRPESNVHILGPDSPECVKHTVFRDWLRADATDRELYARAKRQAAVEATARGEHVMDYNRRKEAVIRAIYARALAAAGLLD